jgi:hypothetical protein
MLELHYLQVARGQVVVVVLPVLLGPLVKPVQSLSWSGN